MAQPQRKAEFFVRPDGVCVPKARPLKETERRRIFERDGAQCQMCRRTVTWTRWWNWPFEGESPAHVDHIVPRSRGGQNDDRNLRLLCEGCNTAKGAL